MEHDPLLAEQIRYYDERAREYEELYHRRGRHDLGPEGNARYRDETRVMEEALLAFEARGSVLELACGTGLWTRFLVRTATRLLAIDASPTMIEVNRERYGAPNVEYLQSDLFTWEPSGDERFDAIVFGFFLSHVPPERFARFWDRLSGWLAPQGRVFFLDDVAGPQRPYSGQEVEDGPAYAHRRRLNDGREFTIVKRFWEPDELRSELEELGWSATVWTSGSEFLIGTASPQR